MTFYHVLIRGGSALASFLLSLLASISLSKEGFGEFTYFFGLFLFISVVLRLGLDKVSIRWITPYLEKPSVISFYLGKVLSLYFLALFLSIPVQFYIYNLHSINIEGWMITLAGSLFSIHLFIASLFRALDHINFSIFMFGIFVQLSLSFNLVLYPRLFEGSFFISIIFASILGILISVSYYFYNINLRPKFNLSLTRREIATSFYLMINNLSLVGFQQLPIIILGIVGSTLMVADYQYSVLFSMIFGIFPLIAISVYEVRLAQVIQSPSSISKLIKVINSKVYFFIALSSFFSFFVFLIFTHYEIELNVYLILSLSIAQIFNIFSVKFQIYNNVCGSPLINARILLFSLCLLVLMSFFLNDYIGIYGVTLSVLLAYIIKFILLSSFTEIDAHD